MDMFFRHRNTALREQMDDPGCDRDLLENTYRQFGRINRGLAGWGRIFRNFIQPQCKNGGFYTLLDLGCGGGDVAVHISRLAKRAGTNMKIHGTDPDKRAWEYAVSSHKGSGVEFLNVSLDQLAYVGRKFDFIISNHLMHHIEDDANTALMNTSSSMCRKTVLFNDIHRSATGYLLFGTAIRPFFPKSFIIPDGLTSIKRSYRKKELAGIVPDGWEVRTLVPFRLLAIYHKPCR
jgi:2-polyprenyl-3-methyl-5-hydroxy-6-metoxy-1,4-benzoquinol methylase